MAQANPTPISSRQAEKLIKQSAKKIISESGIDPSTRRGNKEFNHLVKKLSLQTISTSTEATKLGEDLGQRIVALSQKLGRKSLDRGVIQQLVIQKDIPSVAAVSKEKLEAGQVQPIQEETSSPNAVNDTQPSAPRSSSGAPVQAQPLQTPQAETIQASNQPATTEALAEVIPEVSEASEEEPVSVETPELEEDEEEPVSVETPELEEDEEEEPVSVETSELEEDEEEPVSVETPELEEDEEEEPVKAE